MRVSYTPVARLSARIAWMRTARVFVEYAVAVGAGLLASYLILLGQW